MIFFFKWYCKGRYFLLVKYITFGIFSQKALAAR